MPKGKTLAQRLQELGGGTQTTTGGTPIVAPTPYIVEPNIGSGVSTSASQEIKANQGLAGDYDKILASRSKEQLQLDKLNAKTNIDAQVKKIRWDAMSTPEEGNAFEQLYYQQKGANKLVEHKERVEKINEINAKISKISGGTDAEDEDFLTTASDFITKNVTNRIHDLFVDSKSGFNNQLEALRKEKKELEKVITKDIRPAMVSLKQKISVEKLAKEQKLNILEAQRRQAADSIEKVDGVWEYLRRVYFPSDLEKAEDDVNPAARINAEQALIQLSISKDNETERTLDAFLDGNTSGWAGVYNKSALQGVMANSKGIASAGVIPMVKDLMTMQVASQVGKKPQQEWTDGEKALMTSYATKQNLDRQEIMKEFGWYHAGEGVGTSLEMMGGMLLSGGAAAFGEKMAASGAKKYLSAVVAETALGSASRKLSTQILRKGAPIFSGITGLTAQAVVSPMTYRGMARKYIGETELVTAPDGEQKILVRDGLYNYYNNQYSRHIKNLNADYDKLVAKPNKTEVDEQDLEYIKNEIEKTENLLETVRPKRWLESFAYGLTETMKETGSERFVGELASGKNLAKLGNNKFSKWIDKKALRGAGSKTAKFIDEVAKEGSEVFNKMSFGLGKLSSKAMYHSGVNNVYHGLPGEILEEIAVQATPTLGEDYSEQLKELKNPEFYADIIGQTLLMSGGMTTLGAVSKIRNYKANQQMYDMRKSIRDTYKQMDKAVTDDELAKLIVMQSGGNIFSIEEYEQKIEDLRKSGKEEDKKQADTLEQKKFFNLAVQAIKTNTLDEFEESLDKLQQRMDPKNSWGKVQFSPATVANLALAKEKIADVKKTYEKYKGLANVGTIVDLASKKITNRQTLKELDAEIQASAVAVNEELNNFRSTTRKKDETIYDVNTLFDNEENDEAHAKFLAKIAKNEEHLPNTSALANLLYSQNQMRYVQAHTMRAFNEQISPAFVEKQKSIKGVHSQIAKNLAFMEEKQIQEGIAKIDSQGKLIMTKPLIDYLFRGLDKTITKGLQANEINKIKQEYYKAVESKEMSQAFKYQMVEATQAIYDREAKRKLKEKEDEEKLKAEQALIPEVTPEAIPSNTEVVLPTDTSVIEQVVPPDTSNVNTQEVETLPEISDEVISAEELAQQQLLGEVARTTLTKAKFPYLLNEIDTIVEEYLKGGNNITKEQIKSILPSLSNAYAEILAKELNGTSVLNNVNVEEDVLGAAPQSIIDTIESAENAIGELAGIDLSVDTTDPNGSDSLVDDVTLQPLSTSGFNAQQNAGLKEIIKNVVVNLKKELGKDVSFQDLIYHFIKYGTKDRAEQFFNAYRLGWEANGYKAENYDDIYNEIFEPGKQAIIAANIAIESLYSGSNTVSYTATEPEMIDNSEKQTVEIDKAATGITIFTEDNIPVRLTAGTRTVNPALKMGYNALRYIEVEIAPGIFERQVVVNGDLNTDDTAIDFKDLLNPDMYNVGTEIQVIAAPENTWNSINIYVGRDADNKPITKSFATIVAEKTALDSNFRNTQEFRDTIPMFLTNEKGVPVAHVHETSWYNVWSVNDPSNPTDKITPNSITVTHQKAIEEQRKGIADFRNAVLTGEVATVTVIEKKEGPYHSIGNKKDVQGNPIPLFTINQANPQAELVVQKDKNGQLFQGKTELWENDKRKIINIHDANGVVATGGESHTWQLRRIGIDPVDGKETWRAFKVVRYPQEAELETLRWAWSAYSLFDDKVTVVKKVDPMTGEAYEVSEQKTQITRAKHLPEKYQLTKAEAEKILDDIEKVTGLSLLRFKDAMAFFKLFMQPIKGPAMSIYGENLYREDALTGHHFRQHTSLDGLGENIKTVSIENGIVKEGKVYREYLKDTIQTEIKSFNVGTEESPVYATSVQPTITFDYKKETTLAEDAKEDLKNQVSEETTVQNIETVEDAVATLKKLEEDLGFDFNEDTFQPTPLRSVESLKNIFHLTPLLNLKQEQHIVNYIYNYINAAIDFKYGSKINIAQLQGDLKKSFNEIIGVTQKKVQTAYDTALGLQVANPSPETAKVIANAERMLNVFKSIEENWDKASIKAKYEKEGLVYTGQLGIADKAMLEIEKTTDIKGAKTKENYEDEEEGHTEEDKSQGADGYDATAFLTENGKNKTTYRLRRFMSGIPKIDENGNQMKGFLGLPEYINYNEVYDTIYQLLGSGVYIGSDYETMKQKILEMKNAHPWVISLMNKFDKADEQLRKEFGYNYRKHGVNMKFSMISESNKKSTLQVFDTNANEINRRTVNTWKSHLKASPLMNTNNGTYNIDEEEAKRLLAQHASWGTEGHLQDREVVRAWLNKFGITLSDGYWKELQDVGFQYQGKIIPYKLMFQGATTPIGLLKIYLEKVVAKKLTTTDIETNTEGHPYKDMKGVITALAKGETRYSTKILSKSFRDAGKNISGITNPTYATNRIDDLKRAALEATDTDSLLKQLQEISFSSNSTILQLLANDKTFASKFEINFLGLTALKEKGKKSNNFSSITDLNSMDHDVTKMTMFQDVQQGTIEKAHNGFGMRIARMFMPTMSDKSQMYLLATGVYNFMAESKLAFKFSPNGKEISLTKRTRELLYQKLILPEMNRIANFHQKLDGATDVKDYDKGAQMFNFIPELNNVKDENGNRIIFHLIGMPVAKVEELYKEQLIDVAEKLVHTLAAKKAKSWNKLLERDKQQKVINIKFFDSKYLDSGVGSLEDKFKVGTYDFVINSMLQNADTFTILAGDPAQYAEEKHFYSTEKSIDEDGKTTIQKVELTPALITDDTFFNNLAKKQGINIGKRLAILAAPGMTLADSEKKTYKQIFLQDDYQISENAKYLINLYGQEGDLESPLFEGDTIPLEDILDSYEEQTPTRKKVIINALEKKYPHIADYFNMTSTDAQEYTTLKEHVEVLYGQGRMEEATYNEVIRKADAGEQITKEELSVIFQPIKPVYTGEIIERNTDGSIKNDMARMMYIKSSSFPLIPQLTAGLKIDALRIKMEELEKQHNVPVRAAYISGVKVGAAKINLNPFDEESLKMAEGSMVTLNRNDFRIQQDVPFKSDEKADKIAMGTQIFKLLFGDGMLKEKGFFHNGIEMTGQELYDEYNRVFKDLIAIKKQGLYDTLGLDEFGNPFDEKVTAEKVQALLQEEATSRDYPLQDIKGLELQLQYDKNGNEYYEFKIPLWLSANSNRFESLLNAIVTKRVMEHKMPGTSLVVGTESGFNFKDNLEGIDKSRIIYFDNFNGKALKGAKKNKDGTFQKSQVLVPSKFKDNKGKLVDLFAKDTDGNDIYITRRENGTLALKPGMISPELLHNFSFRTPTSGHVSGSTLEIAGILPPECGDLMIVNKNFVVQKGLDYDVDKENLYQLHHVTDPLTHKISVLSEAHKNKKLAALKNALEKEENIYTSELGLPSMDFFFEILRNEFDDEFLHKLGNEQLTLEDKIYKIEQEYNQKLLENDFIKIHSAVFNNPASSVQQKINKVLSMDFAKEQAGLITDFIEEGVQKVAATEAMNEAMASIDEVEVEDESFGTLNNPFTILSEEYQKEKMALGSAGKMAIGVYSNYVTFHSLVQQTARQLRLQKEETLDNGEKIYTNKDIIIGDTTSDGILGKIMTLDGGRPIAESFAEKQNTATDNEKEQILGRVNINNITIGVDSLLALLGFDKTTYQDTDEDGKPVSKDLSVSYALLSQPIIKEYVAALQAGRGITSEFVTNLEDKVKIDLFKKYKNVEEGKDSSILTGDNLVEGLRTQGTNHTVQVEALKLFVDLVAYAKNLGKVQSLLNTNNLGKSIVESNMAYDNLKEFPKNTLVSNVGDLIGEFIPIADSVRRPVGYEVIGDYFVKANTPQGQIVVTGLQTAQKLWSDYFPYNDVNFKAVIDTILANSNIDLSSSFKVIEAQQQIIREVKKYINSWTGLGLFTDSAHNERKRLFIDTTTNTSLAKYLNETTPNSPVLKANKLLNRFDYDVQTNGTPSLIKYNNTISDSLDEKYLYTSIAELMIENKELPPYNGKPFNTRLLAQELASYAYIEGGSQEAIQFIKYIPLEYLDEVGVRQGGQFIPTSSVLQRINTTRNPEIFKELLGLDENSINNSTFIKQYFQQNPDKASKLSLGLDDKQEFNEDKTSFILQAEKLPAFISERNKTKNKDKRAAYRLYQRTGANVYTEIDVLGTHGMNEYDLGNPNATSLLNKEVPKKALNPTAVIARKADISTDLVQNGDTVQQVLTNIAATELEGFEPFKIISKALLDISDNLSVPVKFIDSEKERGVLTQGVYSASENTIFIDATASVDVIETFMHEMIHSLTVKELRQYYSKDVDGFYSIIQDSAPAYVKTLNLVWNEFKKTVSPDVIAQAKAKTLQMRAGTTVTFDDNELNYGYPSVDILEFVAMVATSKKLQEHLAGKPYLNSGKSILEKLFDVIQTLIEAIHPNMQKGDLLEGSVSAVFGFIEYESLRQKAIKENLEADLSIDDLVRQQREIDEMLSNVDMEAGPPNDIDFSENAPDNIDFSNDANNAIDESLLPTFANDITEEDKKTPCQGGIAF